VTDAESNSLRRNLADLLPGGDHPEEDVLSAFAEGSLLERERHAVLGHLAGCAECREVLSLCATEEHQPLRDLELVAATAPFAAKRNPKPPLRSWLPWVAVAAGVVIACGVALHFAENRLAHGRLAAREAATASTPPPAIGQPRAPAASLETRITKSADATIPQSGPAPPEPQVTAGTATIRKENQVAQLQLPASPVSDGSVNKQASTTAPTRPIDLRSVMPAQQSSSFANAVTADALASAPAATLARAHWRINEQGQPERAFGDGAWQPVLSSEKSKMRVLSVANGEVWVGGENERVYRSRDVGESWQAIPLPPKGAGPHTIAHIRFQDPHTGTIESDDGTTWATEDGGDTWN
jgi:hypothetical protein